MYRKDGFAVHLLATCIRNGDFLCGFGGVRVIVDIKRYQLYHFRYQLYQKKYQLYQKKYQNCQLFYQKNFVLVIRQLWQETINFL